MMMKKAAAAAKKAALSPHWMDVPLSTSISMLYHMLTMMVIAMSCVLLQKISSTIVSIQKR